MRVLRHQGFARRLLGGVVLLPFAQRTPVVGDLLTADLDGAFKALARQCPRQPQHRAEAIRPQQEVGPAGGEHPDQQRADQRGDRIERRGHLRLQRQGDVTRRRPQPLQRRIEALGLSDFPSAIVPHRKATPNTSAETP